MALAAPAGPVIAPMAGPAHFARLSGYWLDTGMAKELTALKPRHIAACRLRIAGRPNSYIAEQLDVKEETLHGWFGMPVVKEALDLMQADAAEKFGEKLADNAMLGLDSLRELVQLQGPTTLDADQKLAVIREMLDRNPLTNPKLNNRRGPGSVNFNFGSLSDEELMQEARKIFGPGGALGSGAIEGRGTDRENG